MAYLHKSPYQYNDEDIIDFNKINLQNEYNKVNRECFGNQLRTVPLIWTNAKNPLGRVRSIRYRLTGEKKIMNLGITKYYQMSYKTFKSIMAHEMIHVKLILDNDEIHENLRIQHGSSFVAEMNRINNLNLGYEIEVRSTVDLNISDSKPTKELVVIIYNIDGKYSISVVNPKTYRYYIELILNIFKSLIKYGKYNSVEVNAVETSDKYFLKYPMIRSFERRVRHFPEDKSVIDSLLNNNTVILNKKFNKDNVHLVENVNNNTTENKLPEISKQVNDEYDVVINY